MKKWGILLLAALAAALVFTSCEALGIAQSTDLADYVKTTNLATAGATAGFATQAALTAATTAEPLPCSPADRDSTQSVCGCA